MRKSHRRGHRGRRRRREAPSVSIVTQQVLVDLNVTGTDLQTTKLVTADFGVEAPATETVNRKVLRVTGDLCMSVAAAAGKGSLCMFALWAHPDIEDWPTVAQFDPWSEADQPGQSGFEGRPHPRPYGRRIMALATPSSGVAETVIRDERYRTKAERLLRPGWKLSMGLWVRSEGVAVRVFGGLRATIAG